MQQKPNTGTPRSTQAYAALEKGGSLVPWTFQRRALREGDVAIKILYCGMCHTDIHCIHDGWGQEFPLVPGHEIVGEVIELGSKADKFKLGDKVALGVIVDSCRKCEPCRDGNEIYCREFPTNTFDGIDRIDQSRTRGGYSEFYVADQHFVYHLPKDLDPAGAAPLLCAGATTYAPLRHWKIGPGKTVGVVGIGGLGHLAIKFARAMGAHVVAFTTSPKKFEQALKLGAHEVVLSTDEKQMAAQAFKLDFILDTVSTTYPMNPFLLTLKLDGTLCSLGIPNSFDFSPMLLAMGRRSIASSGAAGTIDTKEMLEFCAEHKIVADVEVIPPSYINQALERLAKGDVHYRFVVDMTSPNQK